MIELRFVLRVCFMLFSIRNANLTHNPSLSRYTNVCLVLVWNHTRIRS